MRAVATVLVLGTLFPLLGPIAGLFSLIGAGSGLLLIFEDDKPLDGVLTLTVSAAAFFGVCMLAELSFHFIQYPDQPLSSAQIKRTVAGLLLGIAVYFGVLSVNLGIFVFSVFFLPMVVLALSFLAIIAFKSRG